MEVGIAELFLNLAWHLTPFHLSLGVALLNLFKDASWKWPVFSLLFSHKLDSNTCLQGRFFEFYKYLRKTRVMFRIELLIYSIIMEDAREEEHGIQLLRQCFGGIPQNNEDTTKISNAIERCTERTKNYKTELKEWMLRFMDAVERSTNHDLFVDEELRDIEGGQFSRVKSLLEQFGCLTKYSQIMKLRLEQGIPTPLETASTRAKAKREELFERIADTDDLRDLDVLETKYLPSDTIRIREYNLKNVPDEEDIILEVEEECEDDNVVNDF